MLDWRVYCMSIFHWRPLAVVLLYPHLVPSVFMSAAEMREKVYVFERASGFLRQCNVSV